jgi:hypothetical protein
MGPISGANVIGGNLEIEFPIALTGNNSTPILFFEVSPHNNPVKSLSSNNLTEMTLTKSSSNLNVYEESSKIKLYPNPTKDKIKVDLGIINNEPIHVQLMNADGKVLNKFYSKGTNLTIDLSVYERGVYYLAIDSESGTEFFKVMRL